MQRWKKKKNPPEKGKHKPETAIFQTTVNMHYFSQASRELKTAVIWFGA
jgi:hypothetical protein